jgi:hypothetical protein
MGDVQVTCHEQGGAAMKVLWLTSIGFIVLGLAALTPAYADSSEGGTAIGPTSDFNSDSGKAQAPGTSDMDVQDLGKGTEQPMRTPDTEGSEGLEMKQLIVPNQADYDEARESDTKSTLSF